MDAHRLWAEIEAAGRREARRIAVAADVAAICYLAATAAVVLLGALGAVLMPQPVPRLLGFAAVAAAVVNAAVVVWRTQWAPLRRCAPPPSTTRSRLAHAVVTGGAGVAAGYAVAAIGGSLLTATGVAVAAFVGVAAADRAVHHTAVADAALTRFASA